MSSSSSSLLCSFPTTVRQLLCAYRCGIGLRERLCMMGPLSHQRRTALGQQPLLASCSLELRSEGGHSAAERVVLSLHVVDSRHRSSCIKIVIKR